MGLKSTSDGLSTLLPYVQPSALLQTANQLPKTRAAIARVKSGNGNGRIIWVGDSTSFGVGSNGTAAGNLKPLSAPTQLATLLATAGINAHANSFIGLGDQSTQNNFANDARLIKSGSGQFLTGGTTTLGGGIPQVVSATGTISFTPTQNVDTFNLWYFQNTSNGTFSLDINGGTATTINSAGVGAVVKVTKTGTLGSNTLNFNWVSGVSSDFAAIDAYDSSKSWISVMNAGWPGSVSAKWIDATAFYSSQTLLQTAFSQDLTILQPGVNDWRTGVSIATFTANIQSLITASLAVGDCMLVAPIPSQQGSAGAPAPSVQATYVAVLYSLAQSNNIPIVDVYGRLVSYNTSNALGFYFDGLHPNGSGYADVAQAVFRTLVS